MNVLVTGGAGYIGSHAVKWLRELGHGVVVLDNLSHGHAAAVPKGVRLVRLDVADVSAVTAVLREERIECVMHFAALAQVAESMLDPLRYYMNNSASTMQLLEAMKAAGVRRLVFSSTCATYGEPRSVPIREDTEQQPVNPYGWSKLFSEQVIRDFARTSADFSCAILRYFNVAGAAHDGSLGECHRPETHLIPLVLQTALGQRSRFVILGDDYDTPDGTCIRDYIHGEDLVRAHIAVMQALTPGDVRVYNLGVGRGYSVREIVDSARRVTGRAFRVDIGARRAGDPPVLYADPGKLQGELAWTPQHVELSDIIETAWRWLRTHPNGYEQSSRATEFWQWMSRRASEPALPAHGALTRILTAWAK